MRGYICTNGKILQKLTASDRISLEGKVLSHLSIRSLTPCVQGRSLAASFSESLVSHYQPKKLLLRSATDLSVQSTSLKVLSKNRVLADQVKFLIGACGQRLVFLHSDGWVCSIDLGIRDVERHTRHFFIPFD